MENKSIPPSILYELKRWGCFPNYQWNTVPESSASTLDLGTINNNWQLSGYESENSLERATAWMCLKNKWNEFKVNAEGHR